MWSDPEFEELVSRHYGSLYRFAFSLTRTETDAADLTQQAFYVWATKGHQLRDRAKAKTWLYTTLHREYMSSRRHQTRFPHLELVEAEPELPTTAAAPTTELDATAVRAALAQVDEVFRAPLALFYLEDLPYKEIAEVLGIPIGTVKSRLARGITRLQELLNPALVGRAAPGGPTHD